MEKPPSVKNLVASLITQNRNGNFPSLLHCWTPVQCHPVNSKLYSQFNDILNSFDFQWSGQKILWDSFRILPFFGVWWHSTTLKDSWKILDVIYVMDSCCSNNWRLLLSSVVVVVVVAVAIVVPATLPTPLSSISLVKIENYESLTVGDDNVGLGPDWTSNSFKQLQTASNSF